MSPVLLLESLMPNPLDPTEVFAQLLEYLRYQAECMAAIDSALLAEGVAPAALAQARWDFEAELPGGWVVLPHDEHLTCRGPQGQRIELPLYVPDGLGLDAGHFEEYLSGLGFASPGYRLLCQWLAQWEAQGHLACLNLPHGAPLWRLQG